MQKKCKTCGDLKDLRDFYKHPTPANPDHRRNDCKSCVLLARRERYENDPAMRDRIKASARLSRGKRSAIPISPEVTRRSYLKVKYGMTPEQFDELLAHQGGACPICDTKDPGKSWCVDHDHVSGQVRGILCWHCNVALGHLRDDVVSLATAIDYLLDARSAHLARSA